MGRMQRDTVNFRHISDTGQFELGQHKKYIRIILGVGQRDSELLSGMTAMSQSEGKLIDLQLPTAQKVMEFT